MKININIDYCLLCIIGFCFGMATGLTVGQNIHQKLLTEVYQHVTKPAYEDEACTIEIPLSEIYTEYELDLWDRVKQASE